MSLASGPVGLTRGMGRGVATSAVRTPLSERRRAQRSMVRSLIVSTGLVCAYFLLPMTRLSVGAVFVLLAGLVGVTVLLLWEVREILRSSYPRMRAVQALVLTASLFFVGFASTYYLMSASNSATFNEPLTRLDSAYFTVTVFATVGFGDIVAVTQTGRAVTLVQMIADLVVIGIAVRVVLRAVELAQSRKEELGEEEER